MRDAIFWTDLLISLRRSPAVTVGGVRSEIEAAIAEARAEGAREERERFYAAEREADEQDRSQPNKEG